MNVSDLVVNVQVSDDRITMTGPRGEITEYIFSTEEQTALKRIDDEGARGAWEDAWREAVMLGKYKGEDIE